MFHLNQAVTGDFFRPYDLVVVPRDKVRRAREPGRAGKGGGGVGGAPKRAVPIAAARLEPPAFCQPSDLNACPLSLFLLALWVCPGVRLSTGEPNCSCNRR